jgi:glycosyltransferase involved in cell wall biosynthesis
MTEVTTRLRVALVFDRFEGGPARAAVTAALAMDPDAYEHTVVAGVAHLRSGVEVVLAGGVPALTMALAGYDVVHTHGGTAGRIAASRAGAPRVVHTWYTPPPPTLAERRAARRTDAFLAVGMATASRALRLGLAPPERLRSIWPAVDLPSLPGTRARARRLLDLPLGARVVGAVGPASRPDVFARAIARLPSNVYGVWVEEESRTSGPLTRRIVERLGGERLRWLGSRGDVADLLPGFDVLAMTGRQEGIPYTAVEATVAGVPLVGTVARSGADIIRAGETGLLIAPRDPRRLADAIVHLLDNPAEARRMSRAARARVAARCDPESLAVTLNEVYRGL